MGRGINKNVSDRAREFSFNYYTRLCFAFTSKNDKIRENFVYSFKNLSLPVVDTGFSAALLAKETSGTR